MQIPHTCPFLVKSVDPPIFPIFLTNPKPQPHPEISLLSIVLVKLAYYAPKTAQNV